MESQNSLIVHTCCAPCLAGLSAYLRSKGFMKIKGYFYNPNIHPYKEFKKRRHNVRLMEKHFGFDEFEYSDSYPLKEILSGMISAKNRCEFCFRERLSDTTRKAVEEGYTHFTSTLLISPYQDQELLINVGNEIASEFGLSFLGEDMRKFYELGREIAVENEIYMQGYCGCIFSEYERYAPKR